MENPGDDLDQVVERFADVQARYQDLGGYELEARAQEILHGLGFTQDQMANDVGTLSGGWKMRVALAQILLAKPELLLLDEPTNYLDLESILWLEQFLKDYVGTVVMTCHDREIMNRVVGKIVEIDGGELRTYTGNYDFYEKMRVEETARREAAYARQQAMLAKESRFVERFKTHVAKAAQVQSRMKKLDKIEKIAEPRRIVEKTFEFRVPPRSGDDVVRLDGLTKAYGTRVGPQGPHADGAPRRALGRDGRERRRQVDAAQDDRRSARAGSRRRHDRRVGHDGLLRAARDGRARRRSHRARGAAGARAAREPGHAAQPRRHVRLPRRRRVQAGPRAVRRRTRSRRAREADVRRAESARARRADEPSRHRDQARARHVARDYDGTLIFVSHDRQFLSALATRVLELAIGGAAADLRRQLRRVRRVDRPRGAGHAQRVASRYYPAMDLKNVGGTPGGMRTFLLGMGMAIVGGYLLLQEVQVNGGYWNWGFGGYGRSFGITLIPLLLGVGMLFANGRSFAGRFLTGAGALIIVAGIIMNLDIHFQQTSLFNTLVMLILLVGGVGLIVRASLPMHEKKTED